MAKNISLLGADYPNVPAVQLPQTGGGTATFYDASEWETITPSFPEGTTDTQYTHVYKNKATNEVYVQFYATYPNGLGEGEIAASGFPAPLNNASNFVLIDFYGSTFSPFAARFDYGAIKFRGDRAAGHTILGSLMYVAGS